MLSVEEDLPKNGSTEYQVYFKDRQGQVIADGDFYSRFSWEWAAPGGAGSPGNEGIALGGATVKDGVLAGEVKASDPVPTSWRECSATSWGLPL